MKLFEIRPTVNFWYLLSEDAKSDFILKTYGQKLQNITHDTIARGSDPEQIIQQLANIDPTNNKQYLQFITKMYTNGQFRLEDANRITKYLSIFDKNKSRLPVEQCDIMKIKKLSELYSISQPYETEQPIQSQRQIKKQNKTEGAEVIINTPDFKVYNILTEAAACLYGKGTQWCTSGTNNNQFENYKKEGNVYVIMAGDRKFQIQMETNQFMDEQDADVSESKKDIKYLSNFPQYTQFLNMLIKNHYGVSA